jgi:hypothetical protein
LSGAILAVADIEEKNEEEETKLPSALLGARERY